MSEPQDKPFDIPKRLVLEAYERVKANKGAAGVDGQSIDDFESDLRNNLFHDDSYGYRPRRSALDAVAKCRQRCWKKDWGAPG